MGASSSSERRDLEQLRETLQLEVEEEGGALRVYLSSSSADDSPAGGRGESSQSTENASRDTEREEREGDHDVTPMDESEGDGEGEVNGRQSETDSDTEDEDEVQRSTLSLLARLFGARTGLTRKCTANKAAAREHVVPPPEPMHPSCDLYQEMMQFSTGVKGRGVRRTNMCDKLNMRQVSLGGLSEGQKVNLTQHIMPRHPCLVDVYTTRVFCGTYSSDGSIFISAVQDNRMYLYETTSSKFEEYKTVLGRDVGWSILDVVFSPDQQWFAYSTWSPFINVCNVYGEENKHYSLDLRPDMHDHFCAFSVKFSSDGTELVTASSDGYLYIYNREICDRTLKVDAHQDDADAVALDDKSPHIIYSAGDDGLCKVWDRRTLSESNPRPVGCLAGHKDGITFIDTKGDGRYLITNSKDQSIKLWDIRKFSKREGINATLSEVQQQTWDYRWQNVPRRSRRHALVKLPGDSSVMTYTGHMVKHTLLRARFSPLTTTGQKYIYTACARGRVLVYDVLTGEVVLTLVNDRYRNCVRDVSWHPNQPAELVTSSWDGVLQRWTQNKRPNLVCDPGRSVLFANSHD